MFMFPLTVSKDFKFMSSLTLFYSAFLQTYRSDDTMFKSLLKFVFLLPHEA